MMELSEKEKNALILLTIFRMGNLDRRRELLVRDINEENGHNAKVMYDSVTAVEQEILMLEVIKNKLS